jgi:hypothetical protein
MQRDHLYEHPYRIDEDKQGLPGIVGGLDFCAVREFRR